MNDPHTLNSASAHLRGLLFVLVGPSGVGKNAIMERVLSQLPNLRRFPTYTTRPKRPNEEEGRDHFFVTLERFQAMVAEGAFIEHQEVHSGKFYGTPYRELHDGLREGAQLIADIDIRGTAAIRAVFPDNLISIFVLPPSRDALRERILQRGNIDAADLEDRLRRAEEELQRADECHYRVVNDQLESCVAEVVSIITAEIAARAPAK